MGAPMPRRRLGSSTLLESRRALMPHLGVLPHFCTGVLCVASVTSTASSLPSILLFSLLHSPPCPRSDRSCTPYLWWHRAVAWQRLTFVLLSSAACLKSWNGSKTLLVLQHYILCFYTLPSNFGSTMNVLNIALKYTSSENFFCLLVSHVVRMDGAVETHNWKLTEQCTASPPSPVAVPCHV